MWRGSRWFDTPVHGSDRLGRGPKVNGARPLCLERKLNAGASDVARATHRILAGLHHEVDAVEAIVLQHVHNEIHIQLAALDNLQRVACQRLRRDDLLCQSFRVGDHHQPASGIELFHHLRAHQHVGVVGFLGLVRAAISGGEQQHTLAVQFLPLLAHQCLKVVLQIVSVLFRANDEDEIALGQALSDRGSQHRRQTAGQTPDMDPRLVRLQRLAQLIDKN